MTPEVSGFGKRVVKVVDKSSEMDSISHTMSLSTLDPKTALIFFFGSAQSELEGTRSQRSDRVENTNRSNHCGNHREDKCPKSDGVGSHGKPSAGRQLKT
jgi:hypothetical protein